MKKFRLINAATLDEAVVALREIGPRARMLAGGTDLLGGMKRAIYPANPEVVVNIQNVPGLDYIREEDGLLKIGALTRLDTIAKNETVITRYHALAEAARRTASPVLRVMATIGGNVCQDNRCWYFRAAKNYFPCIRKGGDVCYAVKGDHRYHSIFRAVTKCLSVNPSDTAPALVALNARIQTTQRTINAEDFWAVAVPGSTVLAPDEIVTEIHVPIPAKGAKSAFSKFATRGSIDFPIVNCAAAIGDVDARICLNAVSPLPHRAFEAEDVVTGQPITEGIAKAAGAAAVSKAVGLSGNKYKIQIAKVMVERTVLACGSPSTFI